MGSDLIEIWIKEVSLASDSAAETTYGTWEIPPNTASSEVPEEFGDNETAPSISEDGIQILERVQHESDGSPSTTMEATQETPRTTDSQSNEAGAMRVTTSASRLEAMWQRRRDRVDEIQSATLSRTQRMELSHQSTTLTQSMGRLRASTAPQSVRSRCKAALGVLQADIKAFDAQRELVTTLMHDLRNSDIELDNALDAVAASLAHYSRNSETEMNKRSPSTFDGWSTTPHRGSPWDYDDNTLHGQSASSTQVNFSKSHGQVPEQLQDYYDAAIQVRFMQERLDDLYTERAEQLTRRDLLMEQDCLLDESDEDFDAMWDEDLSSAQNSLDEARAALQIAAAACEKSNLDIPGSESLGWLKPIDAQRTWLTTAKERECTRSAYTTPRDQPGNTHPGRDIWHEIAEKWYSLATEKENAKPAYTTSNDQPGNVHPDHNSILDAKIRVPGPQQIYSFGGKPRIVRETRLPSTLNGQDISAVPDVGAAANFIALRYVHSHGLNINSAARKLVQTAVGSAVDVVGTVTLPFSFKDEKQVHHLNFNVMREAVHDVIIGSPFLKLTKTYTRYKHRLQQMLREVRLPRLRFLGSHQYVRGWVNGTYVDAVPDTGADVPVMSLAFAEQHGFIVDTNAKHRILLQFADGSTATTMGIVRDMNWSFGSSEIQHDIDVYVLEELQPDLILDNTFLYDTNAFVSHERDFWTANSDMLGDSWMVSIIKLVDRVLKGSRSTNSATSPTNPAASSDEAWRLEKSRRLNAYSLARKHAQSMTEDQKEAFLQPHLAQGKQFLESNPGRSPVSQSSISPTTSSTSTQAGMMAPTATSTTVRHSRFFHKLRVFK